MNGHNTPIPNEILAIVANWKRRPGTRDSRRQQHCRKMQGVRQHRPQPFLEEKKNLNNELFERIFKDKKKAHIA